jgi:predicted glutamine amidotransferase
MCLILQLNKESQITEEQFKKNLEKNSDGTGIMFANNNKIIVKREIDSKDKQVNLFTKYVKAVTQTKSLSEVFVHSRLATHGEKDLLNCHPYEVLTGNTKQPELYCMHNGIIGTVDLVEKDKSDTFNFLKYYVKPLLEGRIDLLQNSHFQQMISKYIGTGSKLVFLDSTGLTTFIHKEQGTIYKGCWISNTYSGISIADDNRQTNNNYYNNYNYLNSKKKEETTKNSTSIISISSTKDVTPIKKDLNVFEEEKDPDVERFAQCVTSHKEPNTNWFDEEIEMEKAEIETIAMENGIPLVCTALSLMDDKGIHKFTIENPILAAECLSHLISKREITFKV